MIEPVGLAFGPRRVMGHAVQRAIVHQVNVHQTVLVVIQDRRARAIRLDDVRDPRVAKLLDEIRETGGGRDVLKTARPAGRG